MKLFWILVFGQAVAGLTMLCLHLAHGSPRIQRFAISDDPHRATSDAVVLRSLAINAVFSVVLIYGCAFAFRDVLFYDGSIAAWRFVVEALTVLVLYDFAYYFVHRYPFHEWKILRAVHSVHHASRNPRSIDSLLLHPVETALGLLLFLGAIALVGGVHLHTFAVLFVLYTMINVANHAGLDVQRVPFKTLGVLAVKHDKHHHSMLSGNYASITPLPDLIFGTAQ